MSSGTAEPAQTGQELRRATLGVLARAPAESLEARWTAYLAGSGPAPGYTCLRGPEVGLTMVRGRTGGTGRPFNIGEATVTRCTLRTEGGQVGTAYILGRRKRQAEIAALIDALLQDPGRRDDLRTEVVEPLAAQQSEARDARAADAARTRVEFFTLVRGED